MSPKYHLCCVKKCLPSIKDEKLRYHKLPTDLDFRNLWIQKLNPLNVSLNTKNVLVCSRHFHNEDYCNSDAKKKLTRTAVPHLEESYHCNLEDSKNNSKYQNYLQKNLLNYNFELINYSGFCVL